MTCSSKIFKYSLAVLAETSASYILMYCNASSTAFTAVHCFQFKKKVLELNVTLDQSSDRTVKHLCLWLQNEHGQQFCEEFASRPGGGGARTTMKPMPANRSFYCRAKYNNQESYYRAIEGRSHDNFQSCIFIHGWYFLRCYFGLSHNSIHRHEHHCRSFPLEKVRIDLAELPP